MGRLSAVSEIRAWATKEKERDKTEDLSSGGLATTQMWKSQCENVCVQ